MAFDPDDELASPVSPSDESDLRELEQRIDRLKAPEGGGNKLYARGVALVTSLGFVLAGCIALGAFGGNYLSQRFGSPLYTILGIGVGLLAAGFACVKLLKPFMADQE